MANVCYNTLMVRGRGSEIDRYMDEFNTLNLQENYAVSVMDGIRAVRHCSNTCIIQYETRNSPYLDGLLEFLKRFPSLSIRLVYEEYLGGFHGYLNYKKGAVRYFKEERMESIEDSMKLPWTVKRRLAQIR